MSADLSIIASRRHPVIEKKLPIWQQIERNYYGGQAYKDGGYLFKYPKESDGSFKVRKARAVLFNQLSPIVDLLVGFIFANKPQRSNTKEIQYIIENASKGASIDFFMRSVAKWSLMFTCGVLVDSPEFNTDIIQTELDRETAGLNPYAVLYKPERIRDFSVDSIGQLRWVLLDNSYLDNSDPLKDEETVKTYRLWTVDTWQDYIIDEPTSTTGGGAKLGESGTHTIGYVPFKFVNWIDDNVDFIAESICEDLALINQAIYNNTSYMDEMLASGTFKMLFYPSGDGEVPPELKKGMSSLGIVPFPTDASKQPYFDGAQLEEITPFLSSMEFYMSELLKKIGMDNDEEKAFVKSGAARKMDFEKVKTLLTAGALTMELLELWIYETAQKWMNKDSSAEVSYTKDFLSEDTDERLARFAQVLLSPSEKAKKAAQKLIASTVLSNDIAVEDMQAIEKEIEDAVEPEIDVPDLIDNESNENNEEEEE